MSKIDYKFNRPDASQPTGFKPERVTEEVWKWGVVMKDGSELHQFDKEKGEFHQFGEINQAEVEMFTMYKFDEDGNIARRFDIVVPEGAQIFHFYRNFIYDGGGASETRKKAYVFGYKHEGKAHYNYITADDTLIQSPEDIKDFTKYQPK